MDKEEKGSDNLEEFMVKVKNEAAVVNFKTFIQLATMYMGIIPIAGAAGFRTQSEKRMVIIINYDYYRYGIDPRQDFTDCIAFEICHEGYELWATRNETSVDPFGPAHYEAIRYAMEEANKAGLLDRYLLLKKTQFELFQKMGDTKAREELSFYERCAEKLKEETNLI
jgi:hypothetical protein